MLAAAMAVPAFAAPSGWNLPTLLDRAEPAAPRPMGFETPGESFPVPLSIIWLTINWPWRTQAGNHSIPAPTGTANIRAP